MSLIQFFLQFHIYENIGNILVVVSIILTIITSNFIFRTPKNGVPNTESKQQEEVARGENTKNGISGTVNKQQEEVVCEEDIQKDHQSKIDQPDNRKEESVRKARIAVFSVISSTVLIAAIIIGLSIKFEKEYGLVPDLYGMSYDSAIDVLRENNLDGRLALKSTNPDITNSSSRIIWQSVDAGEVAEAGTKIVFVIDNCFSLNNHSLIDFKGNSAEPEIFPTDDFEKNLVWNIRIEIPTTHYEACNRILNGRAETVVVGMPVGYYADEVSKSLEAETIEFLDEAEPLLYDYNFTDMMFIGKLIPANNNGHTSIKEIISSNETGNSDLIDDKTNSKFWNYFNSMNPNCHMFLPEELEAGEYRYAFCFIDKEGNSYEWEHNVEVVWYDNSINLEK